MGLVSELKRRNVLRMAAYYVAAAWAILQVAEVLMGVAALPEWTGRVVLVLLAIGFPIALVLSWFYEVTPEGILPDEKAAEQRQGAAPSSGRAMDFVVIAVLAAAVLLFAWDKWYPDEAPARSIAVLPFVNMTADEDTDHLGTGIADTILNMLAQVPDLNVTSQTSSFHPKLEGLSAPEIAGLLGVATLLEGSVQRQGNRLRITAQLIDAENDTHLWSSNFTRDDEDIFKVQDEIAAAVTSALHVVMRDEVRQRIDQAGTDNAEAYDLFLQAQALMEAGTTSTRKEAIPLVKRALELDPDYTLAHILLANLSEHPDIWPEITHEERQAQGLAAAEKATELAPDLPAALVLLASWTRDENIKRQLFKRAYENGPNDVMAIVEYARFLMWTGQAAESDALVRKALTLDPLNERTYLTLAQLELSQNRHDRAFEIIDLWQERFPESPLAWSYKAYAHWMHNGDFRSSMAASLKALELDPEDSESTFWMTWNYLVVGMPEEAQRWNERLAGMGPFVSQFAREFSVMLNVYYQRHDEQVFTESRQLILENIPFGPGRRLAGFFVEYGERLGRQDEVLATYEELAPKLFADPPDLEEYWQRGLFAPGLALLRHGDVSRGALLMRAFLEFEEKRENSYSTTPATVGAYLALGELDIALEKFRNFVSDNKWSLGSLTVRLWLRHSSLFDPIRNEPEFIALLEAWNQNEAEQRRLLQEADFPIPAE